VSPIDAAKGTALGIKLRIARYIKQGMEKRLSKMKEYEEL
jgi:hypothetical protein